MLYYMSEIKMSEIEIIKMVKPSGVEISVNNNPATLAKAKELGWKKRDNKKQESKNK